MSCNDSIDFIPYSLKKVEPVHSHQMMIAPTPTMAYQDNNPLMELPATSGDLEAGQETEPVPRQRINTNAEENVGVYCPENFIILQLLF